MPAILYINDNNLLLQHGDAISRSQGYAWLKNGEVFFDFDETNNAVAACRLEPQQINSRYWQQCEQTAIANNESGMRHAADLVWRHLTELRAVHGFDDVVFVVPSHYQAANLQLLLGIASAVGLTVVGLINKAVFAAYQTASQTHLHIDVQLHQTVCSEVLLENDGWSLGKVEILHEIGLQNMQDALLRAIQQRFVHSDRFDPLHYAETEQQLFDQLASLSDLVHQQGKANVLVEHLGRQHATSIDIKQWLAALDDYAKQLKDVQIEQVIRHRRYDFNGFAALRFSGEDRSMLTTAPIELSTLNELMHDGEGVELIYRTQLPYLSFDSAMVAAEDSPNSRKSVTKSKEQSTEANATSQDESQRSVGDAYKNNSNKRDSIANAAEGAATHLLYQGRAVPIEHAQLSFSNNLMVLQRSQKANVASMLESGQLFIMSDAQRRTLQINDRLGSNLADGVILVIRVE